MNPNMDVIPQGGWIDIVGPDFNMEFLGTPSLRLRSLRLPANKQRPTVTKLQTPDGRAYKLLHVPEGNGRIRRMQKTLTPLRDFSHVPKLLWTDNCNLLFEYVDGNFADISSGVFAADFGSVLANVHQLKTFRISKLKYALEFKRNLRTLELHNLLDADLIEIAKIKYAQLEPIKFIGGLDYVDFTQDNFVYDKADKLYLIDAGSFQDNRAMGQFLVGGPFYYLLDVDVFWNSYEKSGGNLFVLENKDFLTLFHYVMKAGQKARGYSRVIDKSSTQSTQLLHRLMRHMDRLAYYLTHY